MNGARDKHFTVRSTYTCCIFPKKRAQLKVITGVAVNVKADKLKGKIPGTEMSHAREAGGGAPG